MAASIIIPYFNRKKLLLNTLDSLSDQNCPDDFEVILVDDSSDDLSKDELHKYTNSINLVYLRNKENSGCGVCRNNGIATSQGDMLLFLDCDLVVQADYIHNAIQFLKSNPHTLQVGYSNFLHQNHDSYREVLQDKDYSSDPRIDVTSKAKMEFDQLLGKWFLSWGNNISIRKNDLEKTGSFDTHFTGWGLEDCEFAYRALKHSISIKHNPDITAYHQYHNKEYDANRFQQWYRNFTYFRNKYNEREVNLLETFLSSYDPERRKPLEDTGLSIFEIYLRNFITFEQKLSQDMK